MSRSSVRVGLQAPYGGVPEWPKGADCKSVVSDFDGSNPSSPTTKKHLQLQKVAGVLLLPLALKVAFIENTNSVEYNAV